MDELLDLLNDIKPGIDYENAEALIDNHELTSFDIVSLVAELEDIYDISIPAAEVIAENFNSAQAMLEMIERIQENN